MNRIGRHCLVAFAAVFSMAGHAPLTTAQCTGNEGFKLIASDGTDGDWFGAAVALSGNVALVGAYADEPLGPNSGSAYLYRFDGVQWVEEMKLVAPDGAAQDFFGSCVAVDGNVAIIGAHKHDVGSEWDAGQAYVYRYDGMRWVWEQTLRASDGQAGDGFGCRLAVEGNVAAIGAPGDDFGRVFDAGSLYVFRYDGAQWNEEQKLTASDASNADFFGWPSLRGSVLAVAAWKADTPGGADAGAAYVYRYDGTQWNEEQKLTASDGAAWDAFGSSLATDGNVVVVGAYGNASNTGAAYSYRFDGTQWAEEQKLIANDAAPGDGFSYSVSLDAGRLVAGAVGKQLGGKAWVGAGYRFHHDGQRWIQSESLSSSDGAAGDQLGLACAASGKWALLGAWLASTPGGQSAGAAYLFPLTDLALSPSQTTTKPGDTLTFITCGGLTSAPVGLFVVDVSGTPFFLHVGLALFDTQGTWALSDTVPSGLSGLTMDFQSYGFFQPTQVGSSGRSTISFQ